jgi:hypothetical protein
MPYNQVQTQKTTLAGSGVSLSDTSIKLKTFGYTNNAGTRVNLVMADFGDIGYGTLEPGTSKEEQISWTGITQNGDGTALLTGVVRGIKFVTPYTTDTTLRFSHAGGTEFVVSNTSAFYQKFLNAGTAETITGVWDFTVSPTVPNPTTALQVANKDYVDDLDVTNVKLTGNQTVAGIKAFSSSPTAPNPTTATQIATKDYVDTTAVAGAPNASETVKGIVEEATQAQVDAGTAVGETGARLFVNPSKLVVDKIKSTLTVGEDVAANDLIAYSTYTYGTNLQQAPIGTNTATAMTSAGTLAGQSFTVPASPAIQYIKNVTFSLISNNGSPNAGTLTATIRATSAGLPTGGDLFSSAAVSMSTLNSTPTDYTFTFPTGTALTAGTMYAIILTPTVYGTTGVVQMTENSDQVANATGLWYNGSSWFTHSSAFGGVGGRDSRFSVTMQTYTSGSGAIRRASAASAGAAATIGFAQTTTTSGNTCPVVTSGILNGFTGLTPGSIYYAGNVPGTISTTAGAVSRKIGVAISATELIVRPDNF